MKNFLYWAGHAVAGIAGIAVAFSDKIIPIAFPDYTVISKLAIPISIGLKFLWDKRNYTKGTIAPQGKAVMDKIPDKVTGVYGSKAGLPSGLSDKQ